MEWRDEKSLFDLEEFNVFGYKSHVQVLLNSEVLLQFSKYTLNLI